VSLSLNSDAPNMGAVTEQEVAGFAQMVAGELDCEWEWTTGGCIYIAPIMYIDRRVIGGYPWQAIECVIHEATHRAMGYGHGMKFFRTYAGLLTQFAGGGRMIRGPKRYILPPRKDFPHWRLVVGSLGGFMVFAATWT